MAMTTATTTAPLTAAVSSCLQSENGDRDNEDENEDAEEDEDADNNTHIRMVGPHPPFSMGGFFFVCILIILPLFCVGKGIFLLSLFSTNIVATFPHCIECKGFSFLYVYKDSFSHLA